MPLILAPTALTVICLFVWSWSPDTAPAYCIRRLVTSLTVLAWIGYGLVQIAVRLLLTM